MGLLVLQQLHRKLGLGLGSRKVQGQRGVVVDVEHNHSHVEHIEPELMSCRRKKIDRSCVAG
jgi:hypothetical protein